MKSLFMPLLLTAIFISGCAVDTKCARDIVKSEDELSVKLEGKTIMKIEGLSESADDYSSHADIYFTDGTVLKLKSYKYSMSVKIEKGND